MVCPSNPTNLPFNALTFILRIRGFVLPRVKRYRLMILRLEGAGGLNARHFAFVGADRSLQRSS